MFGSSWWEPVGDVGSAFRGPGVLGDDFASLVGEDHSEGVPSEIDGVACEATADLPADVAQLNGAILANRRLAVP